MNIKIELDENDIKKLILHHLRVRLGSVALNEKDVIIEVKSKQNYKSEWEKASFRVTYDNHEI